MLSKKATNVRVTSAVSDLEFSILPSTKGRDIFVQVTESLQLKEHWYFNLQYDDTKGGKSWLKMDKRVLKHNIKKEPVLQLKFLAMYFPEEVAQDIIQSTTLTLFYLQVKQSILHDEIYVPAETAVMLASYAMQAKYGDYNAEKHPPGFLQGEMMLPQRIFGQYDFPFAEWEKRVMHWWSEHKGHNRESAMLEYMKLAQDLEMYGVNYFEIRNKKGTDLWLGVDALGINVFDKDNKLTPKVGFPWSEIRSLSFDDKKFTIKPIDKKSNNFVFYSQHLRVNKQILALCIGNNELYMRRRRPDTEDILRMKQEAEAERSQRQAEQERLAREIEAREHAEQEKQQYEKAMANMQAEMEVAHRELQEAQATIMKLQQQLDELNEAKRELERRERELHELTSMLQSERKMSQEERNNLLSQIEQQNAEVEELRTQVKAKKYETDELQREVDARRNRQQQQHQQKNGNGVAYNNGHGTGSTCSGGEDEDDMTNVHIELSNHEGLAQPELERQTMADKNVDFRTKLDMLARDLEAHKDSNKMTTFDALHMQNRQAGRDKYKTLRQIRTGNTKRRIDQYENM